MPALPASTAAVVPWAIIMSGWMQMLLPSWNRWVWKSIRPGVTIMPVASITGQAASRGSPAASTTRMFFTAMSRTSSMPEAGSMTRPPRMM